MRRRSLGAALAGLMLPGAARGQPVWQTLPPTPSLPPPRHAGTLKVGDATLFHAVFGDGAPVLLLHGGMAHAAYWGHQVAALARRHRVIVMDARGHGRSTLPPAPPSYRLMADDALGLLDALGIARAAIVGWSDGAIVGLDIAMRRPDRIARLFAFGANFDLGGFRPGGAQTPVFARYAERCRREHAAMSPAPGDWPRLLDGLRLMWRTSPTWTRAQLAGIACPAVVAAAEHDEIIRRDHTEALAAAIPGARLAILPGTSHFAMLQDPARFAAALAAFLETGR